MSKFCKYCGKELEEGTVCTCTQTAQTEEAQNVSNMPVSDKSVEIKAHIKGFWSLFLAFLKRPVSVGANFVNRCDIKYALGIIGLQSVLVGLLVLSLVSKINSVVSNAAALAGSYSDTVEAQISGVMFSLPTVFFVTGISAFGIACLLAAVLMLFVKAFKGNTNYKYMLCASALNSMSILPFAVLGLIISLLMPLSVNLANLKNLANLISGMMMPFFLPIMISSFGITFGNYVMIKTIRGGSSINKEYLPYVLLVSGIVMSVAYLLVLKIAVPMCVPPMIKTALNAANSAGDILDSIF